MMRSGIPPWRRSAQGFGLVGAITVLLILSALGAAYIAFGTSQSASSALDSQQTRAFMAARSGLEWGLYQWHVNDSTANPAIPPCNNQAASFGFPAGTSLSQFSVTVTCTPLTIAGKNISRLVSTACTLPVGNCPGPQIPASPDYVERMIYADLPR